MSDYPLYLRLCTSAGTLETERVKNQDEASDVLGRWCMTLNDGDTIKANKSVTDLHD